jgi:uncharacterized membrane protein
MTPEQERINLLAARLEVLLKKHELFSDEIAQLKKELNELKEKPSLRFEAEIKPTVTKSEPEIVKVTVNEEPIAVVNYNLSSQKKKTVETQNSPIQETPKPAQQSPFPTEKSGLEKFIGENLFSIIGIIITVIGVVIGAKYAIDNQLINPLTRIILGYLVGFGLLGFAIKLKKNYHNFSAILLSGSMAINYFLTFAAYSFYGLMPQSITFIIMVIFTVFTVLSSLKYDKPIIAQFGLVGAYTIPFLLSDGSGKIAVLFSYMALLNIGILVISIKKYWKSLFYSSYIITWLIFSIWFGIQYESAQHFGLAFFFLFLFFIIFYATFILHKLINSQKFEFSDIISLMSNSFVFFALGYLLFESNSVASNYLGLFTLFNAIAHFTVSMLITKYKLADKNILYLILGLVIVFITIAIPVQFEGNWVTLIWSAEAVLVFWIGRSKSVPVYEVLTYPLIALSAGNIILYWSANYNIYHLQSVTPLFNPIFLTSSLLTIAYGGLTYIQSKFPTSIKLKETDESLQEFVSKLIPALFILAIYFSFGLELFAYLHQYYYDQHDIYAFSYSQSQVFNHQIVSWLINYTLVFVSALSLINTYKIKNQLLGFANIFVNALAMLALLIYSFGNFSDLLKNIVQTELTTQLKFATDQIYYQRYFSILLASLLLWSSYKYVKASFMKIDLKIAFDSMLHLTILWVLSNEIIVNLSTTNFSPIYGLSILWGLYALVLILIGIFKSDKIHLRYGGIGLLGITLFKLFFIDIVHLNAISKTIIFVTLGILLLVISFLYNKYKHLIK